VHEELKQMNRIKRNAPPAYKQKIFSTAINVRWFQFGLGKRFMLLIVPKLPVELESVHGKGGTSTKNRPETKSRHNSYPY
jgi:hypothetical protein